PLRGRREAHAAGALRGPGGGVQRHPREGRARRVPAARARALGHHAAGLTVLFDRDRARRRGPGRYQVKLRPNERALVADLVGQLREQLLASTDDPAVRRLFPPAYPDDAERDAGYQRSEEHTSELQSRENLVCRLLLEKNNTKIVR